MVGVRNFIVCLYKVSRDLLLSLLLLLLGLLLSPLLYLRGSTMPEQSWNCLRMLLAQGMFTRFVRVAVEWRLGNFGFAVSQLENVVTTLENSVAVQQREEAVAQGEKPNDQHEQQEESLSKEQSHARSKMLLQELYTLLARMYLHSGHIEGVLLLILRVHKVLGLDRLPVLPELDVKTAHLIRASMAAGKLLDGNSLAMLVVKTTLLEPQYGRSKRSQQDKQATQHRNAKVIPFPSCNPS